MIMKIKHATRYIMDTFRAPPPHVAGSGVSTTTRRVHIQMDRTGDTRHEFDISNVAELKAAEARFKELTGKGFLAAALSEGGGPGVKLKSFDPTVERTVFIPALQGG